MLKEWFVFVRDHHEGPFSTEDIFRMFHDDKVTIRTLLWKEGMEKWRRLEDLDELYGVLTFSGAPDDDSENELKKKEQDLVRSSFLKTDDPKSPQSVVAEEDEKEKVVQEDSDPPPFEIPQSNIALNSVLTEIRENEIHEQEDLSDEDSMENIVLDNVDSVQTSDDQNSYMLDLVGRVRQLYNGMRLASFFSRIASFSLPWSTLNPRYLLWHKRVVASFAIIVFFFLSWLVFYQRTDDVTFYGLSKPIHLKLSQILKKGRGNKFELAMTPERSLWMASTHAGPAMLYLTLRSIDKRILADSPVRIHAQAMMQNQVALFRDLEIREGETLAEGYYKADIDGHYLRTDTKLKKFLKNFPLTSAFYKNFSSQFHMQNVVLLSEELPSKFDQRLTRYRETLKRERLMPLIEQREAYTTLGGVLDSAWTLYSSIIEKTENAERFYREFEQAYALNVSQLFQGIITEYRLKERDLKDKNPDLAKSNGQIAQYALGVGQLIADMAVKAKKKKKLTARIRKKLVEEFADKKSLLKAETNEKLKKIDLDISKIE